jgi:hypothetical protein
MQFNNKCSCEIVACDRRVAGRHLSQLKGLAGLLHIQESGIWFLSAKEAKLTDVLILFLSSSA